MEDKSGAGERDADALATPVYSRAEVLGIDGLHLWPDFLGEDEEERLLHAIRGQRWERLARRRVQHYGYAFDYKLRAVDPRRPLGPLPDFASAIVDRLHSRLTPEANLRHVVFDQLTVNEYAPGVGLSPHVDTHSAFGDTLVSISLHCHTVMEFRRGLHRAALFLPRRSALVLSGEARYAWKHYIPHRKIDRVDGRERRRDCERVSLTFRSVNTQQPPRCACGYEDECDSRLDADVTRTPTLEVEHVQQLYDDIAEHFSATRYARWPKVLAFLGTLSQGSVVVDVGCGNGKYLDVGGAVETVKLASDVSLPLLQQCLRRGAGVGVLSRADALQLPYRASCADAALCVAVLHHVSTRGRRKRVVAELARVLRRGGRALLTAWALEQQKPERTIHRWTRVPDGDEGDYFVPWHRPERFRERDGTVQNTAKDDFVVFQRYCHLYSKGELEAIVHEVPGARVVDGFFDQSNWCVIFEATAG